VLGPDRALARLRAARDRALDGSQP
jgi:hypothetical protein